MQILDFEDGRERNKQREHVNITHLTREYQKNIDKYRDGTPEFKHMLQDLAKELYKNNCTEFIMPYADNGHLSKDYFIKEPVREIPYQLKEDMPFNDRILEVFSAHGLSYPLMDAMVKSMNNGDFQMSIFTNSYFHIINEAINLLSAQERAFLLPSNSNEAWRVWGDSFLAVEGVARHISGFSTWNDEALDMLKDVLKDKNCLEIMAGDGFLSYCLKERNINIRTTEIAQKDQNTYSNIRESNDCVNIERLSAIDAIHKYGKETDVIICSWPPYDKPYAYEALVEMRNVNPDCSMLYIGEGYGGCTANERFHEELKEDSRYGYESRCLEDAYVPICGIHDYPRFVC